ncbi:MAG: bifunctional oligoribonuclease/PAP phosphatase NrnA [Endomicrobiales bacterium]|nr:bifunctional oligoribonuclease/PAP phosphatase NrnA [Endomicrobiales bacterium]
MNANKKALLKIFKAIKKNKTFFIAGHLKPDGDTVGTALALASLLHRLKNKVEIYSKEPIPEYLLSAPGAKKIIIADKTVKKFDCAIILECLDFERMGNIIDSEQVETVINIDHHANYNHFGHINYIDPKASSSSEQVYNIFKFFKMPININEAKCLYIGLVTDTGKFQQTNTTSYALNVAASLVDVGLKPTVIYDAVYANKSLSSLNLLGHSLCNLKLSCSGKVAYLEVTRQMYKKTRSNPSEAEGIINYAMMMPKVIVGVLFRKDDDNGYIKVSFRSRGSFNVNKVAQYFGGGGHKNAAGCSVKGNIVKAKKEVLKYLGKKLRKITIHTI